MDKKLPWLCSDHPSANIRRSWYQTHFVMNRYPLRIDIKNHFKYECAVCGTELATPHNEVAFEQAGDSNGN